MADIKVSQLPEASEINDEDLLMIVQDNTNKKITKANAKFASGDEVAVQTTEPTGEDSDSVKLWINPNEAPSGSLNPISNTYGVAQDKGYSQEYVNGKTGITLWENNAPTNDFAGQTINITTNTCSTYEVYFKINKSLDYVKIEKVVVGQQGVIVMPATQGFFNGTTSRWMTSITNSAITFADATTGSTTQNNIMIPIKVVGYK